MSTSKPRVIITGASGLLGRAVRAAFEASGRWDVVGTAFSRARDGLVACDLRDPAAITALVEAHRPTLVIHTAAERKPDVCETDAGAGSPTELLNVAAVFHLGSAAARVGAGFVYIGTDYIFDGLLGTKYSEDAVPRPLNAYGVMKLRGEWAARASHAGAIVLRVPVLFGPTTDLNESAATAFVATVLNGTPRVLDDWQIRVPTFTPDVARQLLAIAEASPAVAPGVYHYTSEDRFTRYTLAVAFAGLVEGGSVAHVTSDPAPPAGAPRPFDCHLATGALKAAGVWVEPTPFVEAAKTVIAGVGVALKA